MSKNVDTMTAQELFDHYDNNPSELYDPITDNLNETSLNAFRDRFKEHIMERAKEKARQTNRAQYEAAQRIVYVLRHIDRPLSLTHQRQFDSDMTLLTRDQLFQIASHGGFPDDSDRIVADITLLANNVYPIDYGPPSSGIAFSATTIGYLTTALHHPVNYWIDLNFRERINNILLTSNVSKLLSFLTALPGGEEERLKSMSREELGRYYLNLLIWSYRQARENEIIQLRRDMEAGSLSKHIHEYTRYVTGDDIVALLDEFSVEHKDIDPRRTLQAYLDTFRDHSEQFDPLIVAPQRTMCKLA